jgi:hypothetical protein
LRWLIFCEAEADFRTSTGLIDRVVREQGPVWLRELLEHRPLDEHREWIRDDAGRAFFDVHHVYEYARKRSVRLPHNRFEGRPAAPGFLMAFTAFLVARDEAKRSGAVDAVIVVWDADNKGDDRREGLRQAREIALQAGGFRFIVGCPDREREAWVLAGFEPEHKTEQARLDEERRELGFCPCAEAHRLQDNDDKAKRSPKRALAALTAGDHAREERCWTEAPLDLLRARGGGSGLAAFLDEVIENLVPAL